MISNLQTILSRCVPQNDCLVWTGSVQCSGKHRQLKYPSLRLNGVLMRGNRAVLGFKIGRPLIKGECACHTCDNTLCLNPEHLFLGSHTDNMQDKIRKNRDHNKIKTHCLNGHPFSGENLIIRKDGSRSCRICMRKHWNKSDAKNRESRRVSALKRYYARKEASDGKTTS